MFVLAAKFVPEWGHVGCEHASNSILCWEIADRMLRFIIMSGVRKDAGRD